MSADNYSAHGVITNTANRDRVIEQLSKAKAIVSLMSAFDPSEHERNALQDVAWAARDLIGEALTHVELMGRKED